MRSPVLARAALVVVLACLLAGAPGAAQIRPAVTPKTPAVGAETPFVPRFEAVAETRLLMEGLALSNYRSVHRLLKNPPPDAQTWTFARGQALLIAETGNLLLLRPPRNSGRDTWMKLAMDMRSQAAAVARQAGLQDHARSTQALVALTASCNRCHQTFRVPVRVAPEPEKGERDAE